MPILARVRIRSVSLSLLVLVASAWLPTSVAIAKTAKTNRVSVNSRGVQAKLGSGYPTISASGRFVSFDSPSPNLVKGDTNATYDVFVRDRLKGTTERVSVRSNGNEGNLESGYSAISANGRFVAFTSAASNLVPGDTNSADDVFVHDRRTGKTTRVSVSSRGRQGNSYSDFPAISADGRFVAYLSEATNLVKGDTNGYQDLFLHDRKTGRTTLVTQSSSGAQANQPASYLAPGSISANGRYIVFASNATNLVANDVNGFEDIFVRDAVAGKTRLVSLSKGGAQADSFSVDPQISADGHSVSFSSNATNLVGNDNDGYTDIYVRNLKNGTTRRVNLNNAAKQGNNSSGSSSISADGRRVAFRSAATNLVGNDTNGYGDVFVRNLTTGKTIRVSLGNAGQQGNGDSGDFLLLAANGRSVVFDSYASNLVSGDTNAVDDIFVRGPLP
jgi:Tol biopolymer transport system component